MTRAIASNAGDWSRREAHRFHTPNPHELTAAERLEARRAKMRGLDMEAIAAWNAANERARRAAYR